MSKIGDERTIQYLAGFEGYTTERVMKSLVGELPDNEKWSVNCYNVGLVYENR